MGEKKNLEIVSGDPSDLDISPVYNQLNAAKPKSVKEKPTAIVIPKETKKTKKETKKETWILPLFLPTGSGFNWGKPPLYNMIHNIA